MADDKPMNTPMEKPSSNSLKLTDPALSSNFAYRYAIGSLMYLMICTRPDIVFAVDKLS